MRKVRNGKEISMLMFMREGGVVIWFVLAFGLVTLALAGRYALSPSKHRAATIRGMAQATLFSTVTATIAGFAATFHGLGEYDQPDWAQRLVTGLAESLSSSILGFTMLSLVGLLCAVGASRARAEEE
jgi:hypothetical protein